MKFEDIGIDPKTGYHSKVLTFAESKFVGTLWIDHVGQDKKISADDLAIRYALRSAGEYVTRHMAGALGFWKRQIRYMHNHLLRDHSNIPILSKAGHDGGYWIAENESETAEFYETFRKRGLTGLVKASRGKQAALVDMVQQISFEFEDLVDQAGFTGLVRRRAEMPTPIEVVDAFLEKMLHNPEKFADGLRKIGDKYGSVLLPRETVQTLKTKATEFQKLISNLGI